MPPTVLRTGLVPILQAVEDRLVAKEVVPDASLVKWWAGGKRPPPLDSGLDIVLWVRGFTAPPGPSWQTGAGRYGTKLTRRLDVVPRVRMNLDPPDRHKLWMSGSGDDRGYFELEEAIIDALILWTPLYAGNSHLSACDVHLLSAQDPSRDAAGWGEGGVAFEVQYILNLTQGYGQ